jgi:hypothetical protein
MIDSAQVSALIEESRWRYRCVASDRQVFRPGPITGDIGLAAVGENE